MKVCEVPECGRKMKGYGLCQAHLRHWKKTGERGGSVRPYSIGPVSERVWNYVNVRGPVPEYAPHLGPCWLWTAPLHKGYGRINIGKGAIRVAHRVIYEMFFGPVPDELVLDHLCRVTQCVRPTHLEPVTNVVNVERGNPNPFLTNKLKTECIRGHPFDEANTIYEEQGKRRCRACRKASNRKADMRRRNLIAS